LPVIGTRTIERQTGATGNTSGKWIEHKTGNTAIAMKRGSGTSASIMKKWNGKRPGVESSTIESGRKPPLRVKPQLITMA
jgi:hypothetical protein